MPEPRVPAYCHHRPTGQAFLTRNDGGRRQVRYLGRWASPDSLTAYRAALTEIGFAARVVEKALRSANQKVVAAQATLGTTVANLYHRFLAWAPTYYLLPTGAVSKEVDNFRYSFADLLPVLGARPTAEVTKRDLEGVRQRMIDKPLSRKVINQRVSRFLHVFRWGTEENRGLVPDQVAAVLVLLSPLPPYRTAAPEKAPVVGVAPEVVEKVIAVAHPVVGAMLRLQLLTGMRPGEVRGLRRVMVVQREGQWVADFGIEHKMAYRKQLRVVPLGPKAVDLLHQWLPRAPFPRSFLFRPELNKRSVQKSQQYSTTSYGHAVAMCCKKVGVPRFGTNRIRHTVGEEVRRTHGLEHVQSLLGHKTRQSSERYAPVVEEFAVVVANARG